MPAATGRIYVDWGKLAQIAIIITATAALGIAGVIDSSAVTLLLGAASGYIFGNGKSVKEGITSAPLLGRRDLPTDEAP
jgi:hypothetical protein